MFLYDYYRVLFLLLLAFLLMLIERRLRRNPALSPPSRWKRLIAVFFIVMTLAFFLDNAVNPTSQLYGKVFFKGSPEGKMVALTFDDGPSPYYTWKLLALLREKGVKANFFLIGREAEKYPELVRRIVKEGHSIGNHTYTHANLLERRKTTVRKEILRCDEVLESITGQKPLLFRPPHGFRRPVVSSISSELGHVQVDWSVCPRDWIRPGAKRMLRLMAKKVRPGSIILLHDGGGDRSQTLEVVPIIIDELRGLGYRFVTIEEMLDLPSRSTIPGG